ncbi:MAG: tryptophan--tRNA ligase, partial [Desulfitobacterium hafniense]
PGKVEQVLEQGAEQARQVTQETMKEVRHVMGLR